MTARSALPPAPLTTAGPGVGDEVLSHSHETRVVRRTRADGSALIDKQALTPVSIRRLRHEAVLLLRLAGVEGVPRRVDADAVSDSLLLHDDQGVVLSEVLREQALGVPALLRIGAALAQTVAAVHRQGIVHRDINPSNVLLAGPLRQPVLIDFNIASSFSHETPAFVHPSEVAGTLACMAPEQTGRTGRPVDHRADLYALGATLYEMASGEPPFVHDDALQLIHDHLVRVPEPLAQRCPRVPQALSDVVARLLEKEPDRRYQSAEGLAHDLAWLAQQTPPGDAPGFTPGERDFAARLAPPSRLVGRDAEIAQLQAVFANALRGGTRAVLVEGAPGVGKTALINELRPAVTARRGWYVAGKFDQSRRDASASAVVQALRALGRLLLSQPDDELAALRPRLREALGLNTGLVASVLPEFGVLLGVAPQAPEGDPLAVEARLFQGGVELMRVIASPARPVVMVIDDLHWAGPSSVKFFDAMLADDRVQGLLLVGTYRASDVDASHPLSPMLERWARQGHAPVRLSLSNLAPEALGTLLREMLRLPGLEAQALAQAVGARTDGNPFDTVELLNALRLEGALRLSAQGWQWDADAVRRHVGEGDVEALINRRIERLPVPSRELVEAMACLSGETDLGLLHAATGWSLTEVEDRATPALEDGLLVMDRSLGDDGALRFRHDRVQHAAYARLDTTAQAAQHLALARQLAGVPQWVGMAAEQYLRVTEALHDATECRHVARLFEAAARPAMRINYVLAERLFSAAIGLLRRVSPTPEGADAEALLALRTQHITTLYGLGRHDEVDAVFAALQASCSEALHLAEAAAIYLTSLTSRGRQVEAVRVGMGLLHQLGVVRRDAEDLAAGWRELVAWVDQLDLASDLGRPEVSDPRVLAAAALLQRISPAAYFCGPELLAVAIFHAQGLWAEHGPMPGVMPVMGQCPVVAVALHRDYRVGYATGRHMLAVAEARGYEPHTAQLRNTLATFAQHWFEPLENAVRGLHNAREGLLQGGSLMTACFTHTTSLQLQLDIAPSLDTLAAELPPAHALSLRAGNTHALATLIAFRQLLRALRGETTAPGGFDDAHFSEAEHLAGAGAHPVPGAAYRVARALAAAVFGDRACLRTHATEAMRLAATQSHYRAALAHFFRALSIAQDLQAHDLADLRAASLTLDTCRDWLEARAADAPGNCLHLLHWVEAERAWGVGDPWEAARRFEAALQQVATQRRPWHHALLLERAARFHLSQGLAKFGRPLMAEARDAYAAWGAVAKVLALEDEQPFLRSARRAGGTLPHRGTAGSHVSGDQIDLLAVLRASQALSSETSVERLQARVNELLVSLTGATRVSLALRADEREPWCVRDTSGEATLAVEEAGRQGLIPLTALRYVQRLREPLVVEDATRDDRFADDVCLAGLACCSLMGVPITRQAGAGELHAVLMLENHRSRGAFSAQGLDAVMLIAGQLAVSLDNAMLYASLERKVAERTEALELANQRLALMAITDPLTGLANRRRFAEVFDHEWRRALRAGTPMGLVMADIDHFKRYNDQYGHLGGDDCLRRVASCLGSCLRLAGDLAARYGGEEFVMLLPGTDVAGAMKVAERLRHSVEALAEPHAGSSCGVVTLSVGVTAFVPDEGDTPAQHLARADEALYEAKHQGRNRVCASTGLMSEKAQPASGGSSD